MNGAWRAWPACLVAAAALAAGLLLAAHHPVSPSAAITGCIAAALLCAGVRHAWLALLPTLLPVIDFAPWTGWLTFEEFDILVLGAAAGAWGQYAWQAGRQQGSPTSRTLLILVAVALVLAAVSFARSIVDAGGFRFGWFQGYDGPMNAVRLGKSLLLAALFAPLLGPAMSRLNPRGPLLFGWGMVAGLALASIAALWERIAFPGFLNFSTDYRTTALFWEMHVGGAALDGFLAMTLPFAAFMLWRARGMAQLLPAAVAFTLAVYASLTTFSRGVYLAAFVSLSLLALVVAARGTGADRQSSARRGTSMRLAPGLFAAAATLGIAYLVFRNGGYRSLAAVFGCMAWVMLTGPIVRTATAAAWRSSAAVAMALAAAVLAAGWLIPKGAYWAYALLALAAGLTIASRVRHQGWEGSNRALALLLALPVATVQIAGHWGGLAALADTTLALVPLAALAVWNGRATQPLWPTSLRRQGIMLSAALALSAVVVIFGGGALMTKRFSTSESDLMGRLAHWKAAFELLKTPADWLAGKGLGRFPASFFFGAPGNEFPGTYRLSREADNAYLTLSGPRYQIGYGEVLRVFERIPLGPAGRYHVEFDARATANANLIVGICTKHLLYPGHCASRQIRFPAGGDPAWQHQEFDLDGRNLVADDWYSPKTAVFSFALETTGGRIDIDNVRVADAVGEEVLVNGGFSDDMSRWFFSSDHHHMPWHMKNMFFHVLFEQGIAGFSMLMILILAALMRSLVGLRAYHPLAPPMVAGTAGFLAVGLFDSLLDVPRVAFLFFLLLFVAIQGQREQRPAGPLPRP